MAVLLSPDQVASIESAVTCVQTYIDELQTGLIAAANKGDNASGMILQHRYDEALALQSKLKALWTMNEIAMLQAAVQSIKGITDTLKKQGKQIETVVKSVGVAAKIVGAIASIVAAVAKLGLI